MSNLPNGSRITVVDYGLGNLFSLERAIKYVGGNPKVSSTHRSIEDAAGIILPGVGAFGDGMANLHSLGLVEPLTRLVIEEEKPILGICLGSQLLARESSEFGHHEGLGWIDASVTKIAAEDNGLRVPHVGWNQLVKTGDSVLFDGIGDDTLFYFVHSFVVNCQDTDLVIGECEYGARFTAAFQKGSIYATQFHPEKSQLDGLRLLKNFLDHA